MFTALTNPMSVRSGRFPAKGSAFTLSELLIVIAIMAVLTALCLPAYRVAQTRLQMTQCSSNLREIGLGVHLYVAEHDGVYPPFPTTTSMSYFPVGGAPTTTWIAFGVLYQLGYVSDGRVFYCPTTLTAQPGKFDYASQWGKYVQGTNVTSNFRIGYFQRVVDSSFPVPGKLSAADGQLRVLMTDLAGGTATYYYSAHPYTPGGRAKGLRGINVLYSDGHIKYDGSGSFWNNPQANTTYASWEANP